jgi:hypothetical protein
MSESIILNSVKEGKIFGALEVDIHVPDSLKAHFEEMTPIFKNVVVKRADIGKFMENYLTSAGKNFKDTRYLIGSMFAVKVLMITPLLVWYLEHGLEVTRVYQVIEFDPSRCFKKFTENITNDRRAGDRDPSLKAIADTSKLIGNSIYG